MSGLARSKFGIGAAIAPPERAPDRDRSFLSDALPDRDMRVSVAALVALLALVFVALVPFARLQLPRLPAFIGAYEAALVVIDLVTAALLLGQFAALRSLALLVLAGGYLYSAAMAVVHALSFPGLFAPGGLLPADDQTTAWLYMFWHAGFPLAVIAYAALQSLSDGRRFGGDPATAAILCALVVLAVVFWLTLLAGGNQTRLPGIMQGDRHTVGLATVITATWSVSALALAVLVVRRPLNVLDLWLAAVMCAWLGDIALSTIFNAGRFDLGFYAGRVYGLFAVSFLLTLMLRQIGRLYGSLAAAADRLRGLNQTLADRVAAGDTELREAERRQQELQQHFAQLQKMEAIGTLTGGMAHDFNNVLGAVIGNLDLIQEQVAEDPQLAELVGDALQAAWHGADLTRRLLAFARRQPLRPVEIDLNELVGNTVRLLRRLLGEDIEVALQLDPAVWPVVADPAQLEACLANLATNARDAMSAGGRLSLTTRNARLDADYAAEHAELIPGDYAMIEVSDTGTGMSPEVMRQIFEPFFTTKEPGKGTGLGLSMVFGFLKQSRGHINVYSELGVGTTFRLYLPRLRSQPVAQTAAPGPAAHGSGERVLVVEDNPAVRRLVVRLLGELGYRVLEADGAAAALDLLQREPADLLFTDVVMPGGLDGAELARLAAERWPRLKVLLTSGFPDIKSTNMESFAQGLRLLSKPYNREELARALREALAP